VAVTTDSLQELVGLRLTKADLAVDQLVLHFGALREMTVQGGRREGETAVVGARGLYLMCAWRLRSRGSLVTGSSDVYVFAGDDKPHRWTFRDGGSLQEIRMNEIIRDEPLVRSTQVDPVTGDLVITFDGELVLEAFGTSSSGEEWMYFEPDSERRSVVFRSGPEKR
jgi:hypothetical protein